jgi:tRNA (guanosine-2'-O-)-methyltransferase
MEFELKTSPFTDPIEIDENLFVSAEDVHKHISPLLTSSRRNKIQQVVAARCFHIPIVLESIYDRGNISAVMRSGEALGFCHYHIIETQERFKEANRVTQGADKWIESWRWKKTSDCVKYLKDSGYKILTTSLEATKTISEIDWTQPSAMVLGNEKEGVSREMIEASDETFIIPMCGFVQSFNISVAGALCLYQIRQTRLSRGGSHADLSESEKKVLEAIYALRTQDSGEKLLKELATRGEIAAQFKSSDTDKISVR